MLFALFTSLSSCFSGVKNRLDQQFPKGFLAEIHAQITYMKETLEIDV